ncbi:MAG: rhomboid family intramembrane serine protease [Alcanivoracaceae bacterium]|nr:rhomboid family intramembrane serine protease [Alcanivoracaceae bacterium]
MFIIPIQDRVDWRHPPILVLTLVILNSLIYFWSIGYDARHYEALNQVDTSKLSTYEWPIYLSWLADTNPESWLALNNLPDAERPSAMESAWFDREFDQVVHTQWKATHPSTDWRALRQELATARDQLSWIRWGFTPAIPEFSDALTSMFLHGDPWHLFGNMLFLLLFAVPLEKHWGAFRLFTLYILSGLCGDLLHWIAANNSYMPSVGASGAISGLMGIYVATYGVRRIEFFYTLGFIFGSFRAPAIVMFPVWLLYELMQNAFADSNVNYLAHAGGMTGGLALVLALKKLAPRTAPNILDETAERNERNSDPVPAYLRRYNEALAFDQVVKGCQQVLSEQANNQVLWHFYLNAAEKCGPAVLDKCMRDALTLLNSPSPPDAMVAELINEYLSHKGDIRRLPPAFQLLEAELHFRRRDLKLARERVEELDKIWSHARLTRLKEDLVLN